MGEVNNPVLNASTQRLLSLSHFWLKMRILKEKKEGVVDLPDPSEYRPDITFMPGKDADKFRDFVVSLHSKDLVKLLYNICTQFPC